MRRRFPGHIAADHVGDAADALDIQLHAGAIRHLNAAIVSLSRENLLRAGVSTDAPPGGTAALTIPAAITRWRWDSPTPRAAMLCWCGTWRATPPATAAGGSRAGTTELPSSPPPPLLGP